jgi:hypothetical protein
MNEACPRCGKPVGLEMHMCFPIPAPEFALAQTRRIRELEQYCYRVRNTLLSIASHTKEPETREKAQMTLGTEPSDAGEQK